MNCTEFERCVDELFDAGPALQSASRADDLAEHAEQCAACRPAWDRFRTLAEAIEAWRTQPHEIELSAAVVAAHLAGPGLPAPATTETVVEMSVPAARQSAARLSIDRSRPQAGIIDGRWGPEPHHGAPRWAGTKWIALAAALVAAVVAPTLWNRRAAQDQHPIVRDVQSGTATALETDQLPAVTASGNPKIEMESDGGQNPVPQPGTAYYDLAQKAAGALGEAVVYVWPGRQPPMPAPNPADDEPADGSPDWINGLQHQLQPIGRSLGDAFDFLWQAGASADSSRT